MSEKISEGELDHLERLIDPTTFALVPYEVPAVLLLVDESAVSVR